MNAGGWQADTITEDLDLSYRVQLKGWHGRFLFDVITPAEIPTNINAFKSQQHRWAKGSIQTAIKLLPAILARSDVEMFKKLQAVLHLTHYMVHPIILTMNLLAFPILMWGHRALRPYVMIPLLVIMLLSMVAPSTLYSFSRRAAYPDWRARLRYLPTLVMLGVGLAVNNTKGVLEAIFKHNKGEFVRTPKLGVMAEMSLASSPVGARRLMITADRQSYRIPLNGLFGVEVFMGIWATAAFVQYLSVFKFLVGPILLLQSVGFFYVGLLSIRHKARRARSPR